MPFTPTASQIVERLPSSGLTLGRLGGSDFDAVTAILESKSLNQAAKTALELRIPPWSHLGRVCKLNGFFTSEGVSRSGAHNELLEYLSELLESWRNFDISFVAHPLLRPDLVDFEDNARGMVAKRIVGSKEWLPFGFLEEFRSLLEGIERWPSGTKCLVVSPFSQSIEYQKKRLDELVPGVDLSHISFSTMDVPITYSTPRARRDPPPPKVPW